MNQDLGALIINGPSAYLEIMKFYKKTPLSNPLISLLSAARIIQPGNRLSLMTSATPFVRLA